MTPRWMTERIYANEHREVLQVVEVYAEGEKKEFIKKEIKQRPFKLELLLLEGVKQ